MQNPYKILIVGVAWVGDMVMSQTLFKLLKLQHGDTLQLDVLANEWASDILSRMPEVNNIILNPLKHGEFGLLKRIKLGVQLRKEHYNQVFILPNSFKSAIIPLFASIKTRTGFIGEMRFGLINDIYKLNKLTLPLMIDRFCALANNGNKPENIIFPKLNINVGNQQLLFNKFKIDTNKPIISFCPAAEYGQAKRWPPVHFAVLANKLTNLGYQILIFGSTKDTNIAQQILDLCTSTKNIIDLCGKTNIADVVDLLAKSQYVISNDSGLMHIACAVGAQVIAIYGASSPNFTPPLSNNAQVVQLNLSCSPCFERTCKFGHYHCLTQITPATILTKIT